LAEFQTNALLPLPPCGEVEGDEIGFGWGYCAPYPIAVKVDSTTPTQTLLLQRSTSPQGGGGVYAARSKTKEGHGKFVARELFQAVNKALSKCKEVTAPRKVECTCIPACGV